MKRIILAYAGAESAAAIPWLMQRHDAEVVAVLVDLGRRRDLVEQRERALSLGVVRCHVVDARDEFARDYLLPALQAGAFAGPRPPVTPALARPIVARKVVDLAVMENATAIAHGAGRGYDRAPFDLLVRSLDPARELITVPTAADDGSTQIAANVWGRAVDASGSEDASDDLYMLTSAPAEGPDRPAIAEIEFARGIPVRVNGIEMSLLEMIESLEIIGGTHGIGRSDAATAKSDGSTFREVAEAPAAVTLHVAHAALTAAASPKPLSSLIGQVGAAYADLIQAGQWFTATRDALDAFTHAVQSHVTGSVRLELLRGACRVVSSAPAPPVHPTPPAVTADGLIQ
jgi:argininosuccinate synthase